MNIGIVGLGLIGGSFAKAVKAKTFHTVYGFDRSTSVLQQAIAYGAIDGVLEEQFEELDLLLVALYPADAIAFIREHLPRLHPGALVVDLCGVKRIVCDAVRPLFRDSQAVFIGGHPMAGKESSNFVNSTDSLYDGASMILTPIDSTPKSKLEEAEGFFRSVGFGSVVITTDIHHDQVIAYTSQLAHVVSSAYVKSPTAREYMGFSAGSFKDMTRVAKLNETMWTELFLDNRDYLAEQIDTVIDNLAAFRDAISQGKGEELKAMLREGREIKERLG